MPRRPWGGLSGMVCGLLLGLLSGCLYVPRTVHRPDPDCQTVRREMVLEAQVLLNLQHCGNEACRGALAAGAVLAVASAVVSGSIVVAGNLVYWLERQGGGPRNDPLAGLAP